MMVVVLAAECETVADSSGGWVLFVFIPGRETKGVIEVCTYGCVPKRVAFSSSGDIITSTACRLAGGILQGGGGARFSGTPS